MTDRVPGQSLHEFQLAQASAGLGPAFVREDSPCKECGHDLEAHGLPRQIVPCVAPTAPTKDAPACGCRCFVPSARVPAD